MNGISGQNMSDPSPLLGGYQESRNVTPSANPLTNYYKSMYRMPIYDDGFFAHWVATALLKNSCPERTYCLSRTKLKCSQSTEDPSVYTLDGFPFSTCKIESEHEEGICAPFGGHAPERVRKIEMAIDDGELADVTSDPQHNATLPITQRLPRFDSTGLWESMSSNSDHPLAHFIIENISSVVITLDNAQERDVPRVFYALAPNEYVRHSGHGFLQWC